MVPLIFWGLQIVVITEIHDSNSSSRFVIVFTCMSQLFLSTPHSHFSHFLHFFWLVSLIWICKYSLGFDQFHLFLDVFSSFFRLLLPFMSACWIVRLACNGFVFEDKFKVVESLWNMCVWFVIGTSASHPFKEMPLCFLCVCVCLEIREIHSFEASFVFFIPLLFSAVDFFYSLSYASLSFNVISSLMLKESEDLAKLNSKNVVRLQR